MNKVVSINLGGQAYQLEEAGFHSLQNYLQEARNKLENDPDQEEIISDLEQAVAERFNRLLTGKKNVITVSETETVIKEMGPVDNGSESEDAEAGKSEVNSNKKKKRLFRIAEGKIIAGVCTGLAAYFDMDVVWVRIILIILGFLTHGGIIFVYIAMIFIVPRAETSEQLASAYGENETAQELIKKAREEFKSFANKSDWKKWKYETKQKARQLRHERRRENNHSRSHGIFGLATLAFIVFWLVGLFSIIKRGILFGFVLPPTWPFWAVIVGWIFFFFMIIEPLSGAGRNYDNYSYYRNRRPVFGGIFSILWLIFIGWLIWYFIPGSHQYFHQGYELLNQGWQAVKNG